MNQQKFNELKQIAKELQSGDIDDRKTAAILSSLLGSISGQLAGAKHLDELTSVVREHSRKTLLDIQERSGR